jgi:acetoin utilization protein AcuB
MAIVSEAMDRRVVTVPLEATVNEAVALARRNGVEHLLVVDGETLAGIVCACDLRLASPEEIVAECMTLPVLTIRADADLEDAAATLDECGIGCLPVVVGGLVLGVVGGPELERAGLGRHGPHAVPKGCHAHRSPRVTH